MNCRQEQTDQDGDNRDDYEKFNQRKGTAAEIRVHAMTPKRDVSAQLQTTTEQSANAPCRRRSSVL
jgi:hypothetical protein